MSNVCSVSLVGSRRLLRVPPFRLCRFLGQMERPPQNHGVSGYHGLFAVAPDGQMGRARRGAAAFRSVHVEIALCGLAVALEIVTDLFNVPASISVSGIKTNLRLHNHVIERFPPTFQLIPV